MPNTLSPFFSVIIPTRNRPDLMAVALKSVLEQDFTALEVVIVNDGSDEQYLPHYDAIVAQADARVRFCSLVQRQQGHGSSYSRNHGVAIASGEYICFLDDDDFWTDNGYLSRVYKNLTHDPQADLYFSNQKAFFSNGEQKTGTVWIEDLRDSLELAEQPDGSAYPVTLEQLITSDGFAHLNCSVYKKAFFHQINGFDENLRYESDRDLYIRAIDSARKIYFDPRFMAYHNIPDKSKADNVSTLVSTLEKKLFQLRIYDKGIINSKHDAMVEHCQYGKSVQLKVIAETLHQQRDAHRAAYYAWQGLAARFTAKWLLFSVYLSCRKLFQRKDKWVLSEKGV